MQVIHMLCYPSHSVVRDRSWKGSNQPLGMLQNPVQILGTTATTHAQRLRCTSCQQTFSQVKSPTSHTCSRPLKALLCVWAVSSLTRPDLAVVDSARSDPCLELTLSRSSRQILLEVDLQSLPKHRNPQNFIGALLLQAPGSDPRIAILYLSASQITEAPWADAAEPCESLACYLLIS